MRFLLSAIPLKLAPPLTPQLNLRQMLVILGNGAVVLLAALTAVHPLKNLLDLGGHRNRRANGVGAVQGVVQVFDMQVDFEAMVIKMPLIVRVGLICRFTLPIVPMSCSMPFSER